jgi:hypothetical protein
MGLTEDLLRQLATPVRNRYFYGKLLDVYHFELEQNYANRKRWLLNRLGLGAGVLCGLEVELTDEGKVWVRPGVAIDPYGREIIVPAPYCIEDPTQPTDRLGRPDGEPLDSGELTICLAYQECDSEPVPVLVGDCDTSEDCAASTVRERYRIYLREGLPETRPGHVSAEECTTIFPYNPDEDFDRRITASEILSGPCAEPETECVVLGTVLIDDGEIELDAFTYRTITYSNQMLYDLLLCLADRIEECCRVRILRYVSGDAQTGVPGSTLEAPLVVEVVDGDGNPLSGQVVNFRVRGGDGSVDPASFTTGDDGQAGTRWVLGRAGLNTAEASLNNGAQVAFMAVAEAEDDDDDRDLPVIVGVRPANAEVMSPETMPIEAIQRWLRQPRIELLFDRRMNEADLNNSFEWLRVWQITMENDEVMVRPVGVQLMGIDPTEAGFLTVYGLTPRDTVNEVTRYLIQIRAEGGNIRDTNGQLLDAEFRGTALTRELWEAIWEIDGERLFDLEPELSQVWNAFVDTGATLPQSGNNAEGGRFHSWFELRLERG